MQQWKNAALAGIVAASLGYAQEKKQEDLSLESLFDLTSSVAAKMEQPIQDAPGIISVYTKADINRLGYYTLAELAGITPGYSQYSIYNESVFETRGQKVGSWNNNKHLVLVDGIPVNNVKNNKAPADYEMPVHMAKRVEFLKGPASALYGIGAFYGVINVVPDALTEEGNKTDVMLTAGNKDNKMRGMATMLSKTDEGEARVALSYYRQDASQDPATNPWWVENADAFFGEGEFDAAAADADFKDWDDQKSVFMNTSYKVTDGILDGFGAGLIYYNKEGGLGTFWMGPHSSEYNQLQWEVIIPYVKYEKELNDMVSVDGYVKMNRSRENAFAGGWDGIPGLDDSWAGGNQPVMYEVPADCGDDPDACFLGDDGMSYAEVADGDTTWHYTNEYGEREVDTDGNYLIQGGRFGASMWDHKIENWEALLESRVNITETMNLIVGANYDRRTFLGGKNGSIAYYVMADDMDQFSPFRWDEGTNEEFSVSTYSGFTQLSEQLPILSGLYLTGGLRYDYTASDDEGNGQLSPRAAVVQKVTDELNIKAMYGTALRAPNIADYQLNAETRTTLENEGADPNIIPDLEAETITSIEGGLTYTTKHISSSLSGFRNTTTDAIDGIQVQNGDQQINAIGNTDGDIYAWGVETDLQYALNQDIRMFVNYAYAEAWRENVQTGVAEDAEHLDDVPTHKVNGGLTYVASMLPLPLSTTIVGRWIESYRLSPRIEDAEGVELKEPMANIFAMDLNFSLPLSDNVSIELQARNVTDAELSFPWNEHKWVYNDNYTPGEGRNFLGSIRATF
jgi:outer membrane receptor for ferrienterochelin and colicin